MDNNIISQPNTTDNNLVPETNTKRLRFNNKSTLISIAVALLLFLIGFAAYTLIKKPASISPSADSDIETKISTSLNKFKSDEEFRLYIKNTDRLQNSASANAPWMAIDSSVAEKTIGDFGGGAQRYSQTNIQVKGVDEADIVKTDGTNIFYSSEELYGYMDVPVIREKTDVVSSEPFYPQKNSSINITKAFPPESLENLSKIDVNGEMFLFNNNLIVLGASKISAFDVIDKKNPKILWEMELEDRVSLNTSRIINSDLYLIFETNVYSNIGCPMPLLKGEKTVDINCTDVYRPDFTANTDSVMTAMLVDVKTGTIKKKNSFVTSSSNSVIYVSNNYLYITNSEEQDSVDIFYDFLLKDARDLFNQEFIDRISKLKDYELSNDTKLMELMTIIEEYQLSLSNDDSLKLNSEIQNRFEKYSKERIRDFIQTAIYKLDLENLEVKDSGVVPGYPLNQFSMDEYQNNLRIATTMEGSMGFAGSGESVSDVYLLDDKLNVLSSVADLGIGEKIYSVRFIEDKGYVVTFKQIDPFYVLDLSNPKNAVKSGELKIPGYSSYLHPLGNDLILGVGNENGKTKLSVFSTKDPSSPIEADKYMLDEYYTEVSDNHHAFMINTEKSLFFIPAVQGGYVFSYKNNKLELMKAIAQRSIKRGLYMDKYFYAVGEFGIDVYDMENWEIVNDLDY